MFVVILQASHSKGPYPCPVCAEPLSSRHKVRVHQRDVHPGTLPLHRCTVCDKAFGLAAELRLHLRSHSEDRPHKCNQCEKQYKAKTELRNHMVKKHAD